MRGGHVVARTNPTYRFLIADDDAQFRSVLVELFRPYFELVEAECGEQAVELLGKIEVHLCILDMNMHVLTGLDTVRCVKSHNQQTPCILITASANEQLRQEAGEAEVYSVLSKPVRRQELIQTVSSAIEEVYRDREIHARLGQLS